MLTTSVPDTKVMLDLLAFEGTKQTRPNSAHPVGSVTAHLDFCGQGRRRNRLQRDRIIGEDYPANVRSDAKGGESFVRLCQTR